MHDSSGLEVYEVLRVELISPPDREGLCAAIMQGSYQIAEVWRSDMGTYRVEMTAAHWRQGLYTVTVNYDDLVEALETAKSRLEDRY